jgi:alpha-D-ribose 1-methylphosphonate 5-triphosphate synthase subunit PhnL
MQIADLARADLDAVVVELFAEAKTRGIALVKADRDDRPSRPDDAGRVPENARSSDAQPGVRLRR